MFFDTKKFVHVLELITNCIIYTFHCTFLSDPFLFFYNNCSPVSFCFCVWNREKKNVY